MPFCPLKATTATDRTKHLRSPAHNLPPSSHAPLGSHGAVSFTLRQSQTEERSSHPTSPMLSETPRTARQRGRRRPSSRPAQHSPPAPNAPPLKPQSPPESPRRRGYCRSRRNAPPRGSAHRPLAAGGGDLHSSARPRPSGGGSVRETRAGAGRPCLAVGAVGRGSPFLQASDVGAEILCCSGCWGRRSNHCFRSVCNRRRAPHGAAMRAALSPILGGYLVSFWKKIKQKTPFFIIL